MPHFMLILNGKPGYFDGMSPEEMQQLFEKYRAWSDRLRAADRVVGSAKLKDEPGKVVAAQQGKVSVVDGPYSEARELVAGYLTIKAADYEEAAALVREHPHLRFGSIAIREVDPVGRGKGE